MTKLAALIFLFSILAAGSVPDVKVSGAMKNIMVNGDLSAYINLDTLNKTNLYGLGPVAGLKGEIMVLNGKVYATSKSGNTLLSSQDKISQASMLVYSRVNKWKQVSISANVNTYADLEKLVEKTARENQYDTGIPFAFKIDINPKQANYHVIDWEDGIAHTMNNHKQFAYSGQLSNKKSLLLGFYSQHHQSIFTHHTSNMHVHLLDVVSETVGHLDEIQIQGEITVYLPEN